MSSFSIHALSWYKELLLYHSKNWNQTRWKNQLWRIWEEASECFVHTCRHIVYSGCPMVFENQRDLTSRKNYMMLDTWEIWKWGIEPGNWGVKYMSIKCQKQIAWEYIFYKLLQYFVLLLTWRFHFRCVYEGIPSIKSIHYIKKKS
jgi:hypothetical protein